MPGTTSLPDGRTVRVAYGPEPDTLDVTCTECGVLVLVVLNSSTFTHDPDRVWGECECTMTKDAS